MRKVFRILGVVLGIVLLVIIIAAVYIKSFLPNVGPPPNMKFVSTPEKIERGKYLANHVMICMDCHSTRDWSYFAGPMDLSTLGKGGEIFDKRAGFPGNIYSANITPAGIGDWTDGEIFRAVTAGVRKNGKPIFPVMPHGNYGLLDPADIEATICYVRSLKPIENKVPESEYEFPMNFIINMIPKKPNFSKRPDSSNLLAYGKYVVTAASCRECHTPFESGKFDTSKYFAGGRSFNLPSGLLTSANLTPDDATGIGTWSKEMFLDKFKAYRDAKYAHRKVNFMTDYTTIMPWSVYAGMTDNDLSAVYTYLRSLQPISQKVEKFKPAKAGG